MATKNDVNPVGRSALRLRLLAAAACLVLVALGGAWLATSRRAIRERAAKVRFDSVYQELGLYLGLELNHRRLSDARVRRAIGLTDFNLGSPDLEGKGVWCCNTFVVSGDLVKPGPHRIFRLRSADLRAFALAVLERARPPGPCPAILRAGAAHLADLDPRSRAIAAALVAGRVRSPELLPPWEGVDKPQDVAEARAEGTLR